MTDQLKNQASADEFAEYLESQKRLKENSWIDAGFALPLKEDYYEVKFSDGSTDEKPFRLRPKQNIRGFMTEKTVTHWRGVSQ